MTKNRKGTYIITLGHQVGRYGTYTLLKPDYRYLPTKTVRWLLSNLCVYS